MVIEMNYAIALFAALKQTAVERNGNFYEIGEIIDTLSHSIPHLSAALDKKVMLIGNGGSASIASHTAIDLSKNAGVRAMAFNDAAALTCLANDYGYEEVFAKQIEMHGQCGDALIAISSSGASANILKAAAIAREREIYVVTFSGFKADNPLRRKGHINFYVPSSSYGVVELSHHIILHAITDMICARKGQ